MSTVQRPAYPDTRDALIDEVRGLRREVCEQLGNDVDRLFDHLKTVEDDYLARRGTFSGVSKAAAEAVVAGWGKEVLRTDDAIVEEVRAIRRSLAEQQHEA